jgi:hypothetical protein
MLMGAAGLVGDRWYRVRVVRPGGVRLGVASPLGEVHWREGRELTLVWRPDSGRGGGAFWTDYDVDGAFIVRFPDVEALEEAPDPLERR